MEIAAAELGALERPGAREAVLRAVGEAGYASVSIDPEGYRRGRLNEALRVVAVSGDGAPAV